VIVPVANCAALSGEVGIQVEFHVFFLQHYLEMNTRCPTQAICISADEMPSIHKIRGLVNSKELLDFVIRRIPLP
jgi:hypothetical protein